MPSYAIRAFAYEDGRNELTVTFTSGRAYVYSLVPPEMFAAFEQAGSKGAFLNRHIRDRYPHRRTKVETEAPVASLRDALIGSGPVVTTMGLAGSADHKSPRSSPASVTGNEQVSPRQT
jgi:KTSC domain